MECTWIIPKPSLPWSMEKLSSMKPVPGAQKAGAHLARGLFSEKTRICFEFGANRISWPLLWEATLTYFSCMGVSSITSVISDFLRPHGLQPCRLICPWDSPGKSTGVGCHFLLQGLFLTQGSNPCLQWLLHRRRILYYWATREAVTYISWQFPLYRWREYSQ